MYEIKLWFKDWHNRFELKNDPLHSYLYLLGLALDRFNSQYLGLVLCIGSNLGQKFGRKRLNRVLSSRFISIIIYLRKDSN